MRVLFKHFPPQGSFRFVLGLSLSPRFHFLGPCPVLCTGEVFSQITPRTLFPRTSPADCPQQVRCSKLPALARFGGAPPRSAGFSRGLSFSFCATSPWDVVRLPASFAVRDIDAALVVRRLVPLSLRLPRVRRLFSTLGLAWFFLTNVFSTTVFLSPLPGLPGG